MFTTSNRAPLPCGGKGAVVLCPLLQGLPLLVQRIHLVAAAGLFGQNRLGQADAVGLR